MKTPDKIKIVRFSDTAELSDYWVLENRTKNDDIEYIRKDTLMERLKKVAAEYKKRSDEGELVWQNMCGINQAIDILNKM